jgi:hypothetical protein
MATFASFPVAGLAAQAVAGPIDSTSAALVGGAAAGAVHGIAQALAGGRSIRSRISWAAASTVGLAAGLAAGAGLVDFGTDLRDLALQGAVSGLLLGAAQTAFLARPTPVRVAWPFVVSALWALGWTTTTLVGVDVETQWAVFGASGALLVTAGTGLVLLRGEPRPSAA